MKQIILSLWFFLLVYACAPERNSLQNLQIYIESFGDSQSDVVACASDYFVVSSTAESTKTFVYYRTIRDQENIKFWYSDSSTNDLSLLEPISADIGEEISLLQGFMGSFETSRTSGSIVISLESNGALHYCRPIHIKTESQSTEINNSISVSTPTTTNPTFMWEASTIDSESIYFQLISHKQDAFAVSGTYTYDTQFTFYNLENVVFNVTESSDPTLTPNHPYEFILMSVSDDNWVTEIGRIDFVPL